MPSSINDPCPSGKIGCLKGTGIYDPSCCPYSFPPGNYCCSSGYSNCNIGGCCPSGSPIFCATSKLCCGSDSHCNNLGLCSKGVIPVPYCERCNVTCCNTKVGSLCCPFKNGVCCARGSCCPSGYDCGITDGTPTCILKSISEINKKLFDHVEKKVSESNDQLYAFIPMKSEISNKCWQEASQIYCSKEEIENAALSCLSKQATGYCAVFENTCWQKKLIGGICYKDKAACQNPVMGSCSWYIACLQNKFNCSLDGYPFSYGFKYCSNFLEHQSQFDAAGRGWLNNALLCLQYSLLNAYNNGVPCDEITEIAFKSHSICFTNQSPPFCKIYDVNKQVLWDIYQAKDLLSWRARKQIIDFLLSCDKLPDIIPDLPLFIQ